MTEIRHARSKRVKVAILATEGFEQDELLKPRKALDEAGAQTTVVSPKADKIRAWRYTEWAEPLKVDQLLGKADPNDYDALLLPGGVMTPDKLRMEPKAVQFVKAFFNSNKPVAVICHGPWMLVEADVARGRKITSWPSIKTDLRNAGAEWRDEEAVTDRNVVSARKPDDIPAFNRAMIELFSQARGSQRASSAGR